MTTNEKFFYDHAGYSYDAATETPEVGRERGARELARAEAYATEHGWTYEWEHDPDTDLSFMSDEERTQDHECLSCVLSDEAGGFLESLGGIVDADRNYGRVVEAELALEALSTIEREERNATECAVMMGGCK